MINRKNIYTVLSAAVVMAMLSGCGGSFTPSKEMVSSVKVEKSVEGMEKLNDTMAAEFIQKVNKKYAVATTDIQARTDVKGEIVADLWDNDTGSFELGIKGNFGMDITIDTKGNYKMSDMSMKAEIPVLGNVDMTADMYYDNMDKYTYTHMTNFKGEGGLFALAGEDSESTDDAWKKKKAEAENSTDLQDLLKDIKFTVEEEDVLGIYHNKNTDTYIVDVNPEAIGKDSGDFKLTEIRNGVMYVTYDKGLTVSGIYYKADGLKVTKEKEEKKEEEKEEELVLKDVECLFDLKALNTGFEIEIPEDIRKDAVETETPDIPFEL